VKRADTDAEIHPLVVGRDFGKLTPHGTFGGSYPTVDAFRGRRRIPIDLEANVVE
jgi:hypothetical protein